MKLKSRLGFVLFESLGVFLILVSSSQTFALDLVAPFMLENAKVLPAGLRNPRLTNMSMWIDARYNTMGQALPLGDSLNKQIKWSDVINLQSRDIERSMFRSILHDANIDPSGGPGSTAGQVNTYLNINVPTLAVGITDRLTVAMAVPIVNITVSAESGFVRSADGQKLMDKLCSLSIEQCNTAASKMNNAINDRLVSYGYEPIQSKKVSSVGDIQLVGKYVLHQGELGNWAVTTKTVLPTGVAPNADALLDVPTGDGRFQLGSTLIYEKELSTLLSWSASGGFMALLPHRMERRIPLQSDDPLSKDKELLTRNAGGQVVLNTSIQRAFPVIGMTFGAGYNFQYLTQPSYSGGVLYSPERYSFLEDLTPSQELHTLILVAGFSTAEWFLKKQFFYPFQANLVLSHPFFGRGVTSNDVLTGELVLFF